MTKAQYKNEKHRRVVELWLGGMSQRLIAMHEGVSQIEGIADIIKTYCDRDRVYSKDGRGFSWRVVRSLHPDAPIDRRDWHKRWPQPDVYAADEDDGEQLEQSILDAADLLNEALTRAESTGRPQERRKVFMSVHRGRLHVVITHSDA